MDFNPCMKHQLIRKTVREFAESEIRPHVSSLDKASQFPWGNYRKNEASEFFRASDSKRIWGRKSRYDQLCHYH